MTLLAELKIVTWYDKRLCLDTCEFCIFKNQIIKGIKLGPWPFET